MTGFEETIFEGIRCRVPFYRSEVKIDEMVSRIWGELIDSFSACDEKQQKRKAALSAKIGSLAALMGIGEVSGSVDVERLGKEAEIRLSHLTYGNKIDILYAHLNGNEKQFYFNVSDGYYAPSKGKDFYSKEALAPMPTSPDYLGFGFLCGRFTTVRVHPPHDDTANFINDALHKESTLWEFRSTEDSAYRASFGCIPKFCTEGSQGAFIALAKGLQKGHHIVACYGYITTTDGALQCDPIFFQLFGG